MGHFSDGIDYTPSNKDFKKDYFAWLQEYVGSPKVEDSYYLLLGRLFDTPFSWVVALDMNRALDGISLKSQFSLDCYYGEPLRFQEYPCSVLEMLLALAIRIENNLYNGEDEHKTDVWFWEMLDNLGLVEFTDDNYHNAGGDVEVDKIIYTMMDRRYRKDGSEGGLFPLKYAKKDQRKVEIWYQMNEYLMENYYVE